MSLFASEIVDYEELGILCLADFDFEGTDGIETSFNLLDLVGSGDFGTGFEVLL